MKELRSFYSDLYQNRSSENSNILTDSLLSKVYIPRLTVEQRNRCEEKLR